MTTSSDQPSGAVERATPVTVIVTQCVKPGLDGKIREWQADVNRAVAAFAGFLGTEVALGTADEEWTVLYRFDSRAHLETWLGSQARADVLERGKDLFAAPATQHILVDQDGNDLVTVVVSHQVDPDHEDEFLGWQRRVTDSERAFRGFRGSELLRPVPGVQANWTAIFRFDTKANLDAWLESPERRALLDEGRRFQDFVLHRTFSPFGSWFSFAEDAGGGNPPKPWKTALSVLMGLYPTVVLLTLGISELWEDGELWETLLLGNVLSVTLLTWPVMPMVNRAMTFWLEPDRGRASRRLDIIGAAIAITFLTVMALVFWLATTQIWTLP